MRCMSCWKTAGLRMVFSLHDPPYPLQGALDKLLIRQIVEGTLPFPPSTLLTCENKAISSALTVKDTNQTDCVWYLHLCYRDLAYSQPDNPTGLPWMDMQISHPHSTIYNGPRYSFHQVLG